MTGKSRLSDHHQRKDFDQLIIETIDEGISGLGEAGKASIYIYLESCFNIRKHEMPDRLSDFSNALKRIFGVGARHIEILIMKNLHIKLQVAFKGSTNELPIFAEIVPETTLSEYVRLLRKSFEAANDDKVEMGILVNEPEGITEIPKNIET